MSNSLVTLSLQSSLSSFVGQAASMYACSACMSADKSKHETCPVCEQRCGETWWTRPKQPLQANAHTKASCCHKQNHLGNHGHDWHQLGNFHHGFDFSILQVVGVQEEEACIHPVVVGGRHGCRALRVLLPVQVASVLGGDVFWDPHRGLLINQPRCILHSQRKVSAESASANNTCLYPQSSLNIRHIRKHATGAECTHADCYVQVPVHKAGKVESGESWERLT